MERLHPPSVYGIIVIEVLLNENDLFYSYVLKIGDRIICRLALDENANWVQKSGEDLSPDLINYLGCQIDKLSIPNNNSFKMDGQ